MPVELSTSTISLNVTLTSIVALMPCGPLPLSEVTDSTLGATPSTLMPLNPPSVPCPVPGRVRSARLPAASLMLPWTTDSAPAPSS